MPGTYSSILLHVVCSTRRRDPSITPQIRGRLLPFMGGIVRDQGGVLMSINAVENHFHGLIRWRTDGTVADLMRHLKSRSSRWVHQTFPGSPQFAWQEGYSVFTVSASQKPVVERYIARQQEHHRRFRFEAELITLLKRHEVQYDPERVFD